MATTLLKLLVALIILAIAFAVRHRHKKFEDSFKYAQGKLALIFGVLILLFVSLAFYNNLEN